ncbi:MAG: transcription repressor NadR [Oscillospiraceae bacterium]|jgi:transcriptional regulator of NAD metabolism|nr:transcription repressor NadR [Oscillospiraceae bacterium]MCI1989963.1 transcription repressor NadR [Oscillospiraceae bacterium]MCI2034993.1 transcription repressor NadR [Oscillospiraceae bacterium]
MDAAQRREKIQEVLKHSEKPVSAGSFARRLGVSRQVIVGDVALLRAANVPIAATPRGYVMQGAEQRQGIIRTIACRHSREGIRDELYTIVDNGCGVLDVIVEHAVYGQLSGQLHIFSRYDVDDFVARLSRSGSLPLCNLTEGVHLHTLACPSEAAYRRVLEKLREKNLLFEKEESGA